MQQDRDAFYDMVSFFGICTARLPHPHYDEAMKALQEVLENNPDNYNIALNIITLLKDQNKYSEISTFLKDMNNKTNKYGLSRLVAMCHAFADDLVYHDTISFAAQRSNCLEFIEEAYRNAIQTAEGNGSSIIILAALRYWYGLTLFYHHESEQDRELAIRIWEENIDLKASRTSSWELRTIRSDTVARLASAYLELAKNGGINCRPRKIISKNWSLYQGKIPMTTKMKSAMLRQRCCLVDCTI
jgi:tetratricopeptide (TPR) repeat protein